MPEPRDAEHGSDSRQQSLPLHRAPDASAAVPFWLKLFGAVNRPWIRIRREPAIRLNCSAAMRFRPFTWSNATACPTP